MALRTFFSYYCCDSLTYHGLPHLPSLANATQTPSKVCRLRFYYAPFQDHRFIWLTYLMPRFDSYCMYHSTLDPLPICLVVDRPWWTSFVYIRRPLLSSWALSLT